MLHEILLRQVREEAGRQRRRLRGGVQVLRGREGVGPVLDVGGGRLGVIDADHGDVRVANGGRVSRSRIAGGLAVPVVAVNRYVADPVLFIAYEFERCGVAGLRTGMLPGRRRASVSGGCYRIRWLIKK